MIRVSTGKYKIEEEIEAFNGETEQSYKFTMQITHSEYKEIENLFFNLEGVKLSKEIQNLEKEGNKDLIVTKTEELISLLTNTVERITDIAFKEHKQKLKETVGEYVYEEVVDEVVNFFMNMLLKKVTAQGTTIPIDLMKIMEN